MIVAEISARENGDAWCLCECLFTATKNADQLLAVWRMVEKFAFSAEESGVAPHVAYKTLVYISVVLSAVVMWLRFSNTA